MADCKAQLKAAARKIQKRTERLVEDRERFGEIVVTIVAPAFSAGLAMAISKPSSQPLRPLRSKATKLVAVMGINIVVMRPVTGGIDMAAAAATGVLVKLAGGRVTGRGGRFVVGAGIAAGILGASRRAKAWAVNQPRLREIEELGLATRLEGQVASLLPPRGRTRCNSGYVPKEWTELKEAGRQKRLQRDAAAK